jgi:epoxyqueuosine reductase QueG
MRDEELAAALYARGAALVGFADLTALPAMDREGLPRGISIAVALDPAIVAGIVAGPTPAYHREYGRVNALLAELGAVAAEMLRTAGYHAATQRPTVGTADLDHLVLPLPHKTVATRAGLGWIGRSALLVTPAYGSAVRLATVLTDAPWPCTQSVGESRCGACRACVDACPAGALLGADWRVGVSREALVSVGACRASAEARAAAAGIDEVICGICISACPWTRRYLRQSGAL